MEKNNSEYKKNDNLIIILALLILLAIIAYMFYLIFNSNKKLNFNSLIKNDISYDNTVENNEKAPIEKEIVYQDVEIATFTSTLYDNEENRVYNISKACEILNDTVIKSGEEFSFNNTIGPMGTGNGYKLATGFDSNGKFIDVPAGGMCQVSSTLYNVALLANLEITERHPHSRRVYYVPVDKDATVYYPNLDLKFVNNTPDDIRITASNDNYSVTIKMYKKEQLN